MKDLCVFCDRKADSREHIIPKWIQGYFDLWDQPLGLWNQTTIPYRQVFIPSCKECNSERLNQLETKVSNGMATEQEYYLWALKIRYCLSKKDTTLQLDIKDPSKGALIPKGIAQLQMEFAEHIFANLTSDNFFYNPNPFGSVFLFQNPNRDSNFGLVDVPIPYWGLTIALPDHKILAVLFSDRGLVKKDITKHYKRLGGLKRFVNEVAQESTMLSTALIMFRILLWQYILKNIPYKVKLEDNGIVSQHLPNKLRYRKKLKLPVIIHMARYCGLGDNFAKEVYNSLPDRLTVNPLLNLTRSTA